MRRICIMRVSLQVFCRTTGFYKFFQLMFDIRMVFFQRLNDVMLVCLVAVYYMKCFQRLFSADFLVNVSRMGFTVGMRFFCIGRKREKAKRQNGGRK